MNAQLNDDFAAAARCAEGLDLPEIV